MKVSHTIASVDSSSGGPSKSTTSLIEAMGKRNLHSVYLLNTLSSQNPIITSFTSGNCQLHLFESLKDQTLNLSQDAGVDAPDLYHGHGLWDLVVNRMARFARKSNKPYIISPRGMLDVWSLNHKKWKKKLALSLYQRKDLRYAAVIHATSVTEAQNIRKAGFTNPIAVIPNGVELIELEEKAKNKDCKTLLFLSRLVKNKGIEELLQAWSVVNNDLWQLKIVGEGKEEYTRYLKQVSEQLGLRNVFFEGGIYGAEKNKILAESDLFVLPTYTENFGVAIAEALAAGIPVITTTGAPWEELNERNAGWHIELNHDNLVAALRHALSETVSLETMGKNGRLLIEEKYSINAVADMMTDMYEWVIGSGEKPKFII